MHFTAVLCHTARALPYHRLADFCRSTDRLPSMPVRLPWTRRQFVARSAAAAAALPRVPSWLLAQIPPAHPASSTPARSPDLHPGALLEADIARPLRYAPDGLDFVIQDGHQFFNRPLYAPTHLPGAFRVDAGDRPEFSLYLPGHGGNLRLGLDRTGTTPPSCWLHEAANITTRYRPGRMLYEIRDPLLGRGTLLLELFTQAVAPGLHLRVEARNPPPDLFLTWTFGGLSGRRGRHNGDLGLEIQPVGDFFQLDPQECHANFYTLQPATALLEAPSANLRLTFPPGARLHLAEASNWNAPWSTLNIAATEPSLPLLVGSVALSDASPLHLLITLIPKPEPGTVPVKPVPQDPAALFQARLDQLTTLNGNLTLTTPDPFLNTAAAALVLAADALWDADTSSVLLGAVANRLPAPGWRGPQALNTLGNHSRMQIHLRHWVALQNTTPLRSGVDPDTSCTGPADPGSHLTRKSALLHTLGEIPSPYAASDLSSNQDMSLAFFDAALRHLRWTGDLALARELWPALNLHLDRQFRLFRRAFPNPDPKATLGTEVLPLYEAYASIPTSDNLQGNGGGATHATAANFFLNRTAATLARLLNEDPLPFDDEANLIQHAATQLLWLPQSGTFAESRDLVSPQAVYPSASLASLCHALDSDLATPRQAWQMATSRLASLRRVPVRGPGVPPGDWFLLPNSDWLPYTWTLNNLLLAENMHTALALWQAGLPDDAYNLLAGNLLDSMYRGLCPGNFHLTSALDPARGETERDSADAIGATSRALIEGLFGILPDLLRATLTIRPGFPSPWNDAALHHPEIDLTWHRDGLHETLEITSRLPHPVALTLILPARTTSDPVVLSNGQTFPFSFDPDATGSPTLLLTNFPAATSWQIDIRWHGRPPIPSPALATLQVGQPLPLPRGITLDQIDDPQACLSRGIVNTPGRHTVFAAIHQESCRFWLPLPLDIRPASTFTVTTSVDVAAHHDPIDLTPVLRHQLTTLLTRPYTSPRSPFCSLAIPSGLLGGWRSDSLALAIDDSGLRSAKGTLYLTLPPSGAASTSSPTDLPFLTPTAPTAPNTLFLSHWEPDIQRIEISLSGSAATLYLLMTGTTLPPASRTEHGLVTVLYTDGSTSRLSLVNPSTWWPIEQDYRFDDYLFRLEGPEQPPSQRPLPPRVDLLTGRTRLPDLASTRDTGGRLIPGGAATVLHLPLHGDRTLSSVSIECTLYGVVLALLSLTLAR